MDNISPIANAFDEYSLPSVASEQYTASGAPAGNLDQIQTLSVGGGNTVYHVSADGMWLGAASFADAPFSVDMGGNLTAQKISALNIVLSNNGIPQIVIGTFDV
jgi:hypothetical protein